MKLILLLLICWPFLARGQLIFDQKHFLAVNQNGASREAAEVLHDNYLSNINDRLSDIHLDLSSVALVQHMIRAALSEVDGALKNGQAVLQIGQLTTEIVNTCNHMINTAGSDPALLLFAGDVSLRFKERGIGLVSEVSGFILNGGSGILMDFEKRDALLRKVVLELKVMRALAYSMDRSMYWAQQEGLWRKINPFAGFQSKDTQMINDILQHTYLLK